jgi:RNA polymerase primary sigma factor
MYNELPMTEHLNSEESTDSLDDLPVKIGSSATGSTFRRRVDKHSKAEFNGGGNPEEYEKFILAKMLGHPILSHDEVVELSKQIQKGNFEAKDYLVSHNIRLVASMAIRYKGNGLSHSELISEGTIGLIRAAEKYDYTLGYKFSTYAIRWIEQSMQRALSDKSTTIRLPVHQYERLRKIYRTRDELTSQLGEEPTLKELSAATEIPVNDIQMILRAKESLVSLDQPINSSEDSSSSFHNLLPSDEDSVFNEAFNNTSPDSIKDPSISRALKNLSSLEKKVLCMSLGIEGFKQCDYVEIGRKLEIPSAKIKSIINHSKQKIYEELRSQEFNYQDYLV